jgi:hypothetical protein
MKEDKIEKLNLKGVDALLQSLSVNKEDIELLFFVFKRKNGSTKTGWIGMDDLTAKLGLLESLKIDLFMADYEVSEHLYEEI